MLNYSEFIATMQKPRPTLQYAANKGLMVRISRVAIIAQDLSKLLGRKPMSNTITMEGGVASGAAALKANTARKEVPYPPHLLIAPPKYKPGVKRVKVDRFFKQEYHDREVETIWKKVWQWVCREEDIPEVGDYLVYDIADLSFLIMRTKTDEIMAFRNACPHRGRILKECDGKGVSELRCMFHGWAFNIDGTSKSIFQGFDFPGATGAETSLTSVKTGTWGGFVFINPDPNCEPLADFLGTLPDHFEGANHDLRKRWKQAHVVAVIDANWKVAQEAFLEPWHVMATHPQFTFPNEGVIPGGGRWDDFGNWMRIAPNHPGDGHKPVRNYLPLTDDQQLALDSFFDRNLNEPIGVMAHPGLPVSQQMIDYAREYLRSVIGDKIDEYHDVELLGGEMVSVFPNFHPWGAFGRIMYRFRPYGSDPDKSIMDVLLLSPWPEDKPLPPPAPPHHLKADESISAAPEIGYLARIFMQDIANMPMVHKGVKSLERGDVLLSDHYDAPVRKFHDLYEKWMGLGDDE